MPIPTELVGSLPRPMKLQEAYADYDEGKITFEQLQAVQDAAAEDSIKRLEQTGEPIVTDGEQRESSFATYTMTDTLAGTGLADSLAGDGQFFAIFDDGHHRQLPRITGGPFRYKTYASEFVEKNRAIASATGQAGGHLALDDDAAVSARGRDRGLLARAVPGRLLRRGREGHPPVLRRRRGTRVGRLHRGPAGQQERLAQPLDRQGHAAGVHRPQQPPVRPLLAPRSAGTSGSTPAPAATATRCTPRRCRTRSCCRRCSS